MDQERFNRWLKLSADLKVIRAAESGLRKELGKLLMQDKQTGSAHAELFGRELSATVPVAYKVHNDVRLASLTEAEKACVTWSPSLIAKEYKKLTEEQKARLQPYVSMKPGSLSITVSEPVEL